MRYRTALPIVMVTLHTIFILGVAALIWSEMGGERTTVAWSLPAMVNLPIMLLLHQWIDPARDWVLSMFGSSEVSREVIVPAATFIVIGAVQLAPPAWLVGLLTDGYRAAKGHGKKKRK